METPNIFGKVNKPTEEDFDNKHTPYIVLPEKIEKQKPFQVKIKVGKTIEHPMEAGHFIQWIELYAGENFVARADLSPLITKAEVSFTVVLENSTVLKAVERCNLHGDWGYTTDVKL